MVNDKNHLFTSADLAKERKVVDKTRTQQQFTRFSVTEPTALNLSSDSPAPTALQIDTKPHVGDPFNDTYGTIGLITQIIFLDVFGSTYNIMKINNDVTFAFNKIPEGRHIEFSIDFVIDTGTPPTVTLDSRIINPPTLPTLTNGLRVVLNFIGVRDDVDTRFTYIGGTVDTAGALSFPIIPPVDVRGNVSTTQDIDLSLTTAHSTTMTLTGDISITFSSFPATANQIEWEIEITQDATGNHDVTSWPAGLTAIPVINKTALATTLVVLRTNDNGTTIFTRLASSGVISPVSLWADFSANSDIDFATFDGTNIDRLKFVVDSGVPSSSSDPSIFLGSDAFMNFNVATLDGFRWKANDVEMVRIEEITAGVYRLDLLDNQIRNAEHVTFDNSSGATVFAGGDVAIGYDSVATRWIFNYPTGSAGIFVFENQTIGTTVIKTDSMETNLLTSNDYLLLGAHIAPTINGQMSTVSGDVIVFSGGAERNLSNLGAVQNSISQLNSDVTVTDAGSGLVATTVDGSIRFQVQAARIDLFGVDIHGIETLIFDSTVGTSTITPSTSGVIWNFPDNSDVFQLDFNGVIGFSVDLLRTRLFSNTPNTVSAALSLFRDDASPTANDIIGDINFDGRDSAGNFTTYADIIGVIADPSTGVEDGRVRIRTLVAANLRDSLTVEGGTTTIEKTSSVAADVARLDLVKVDATPAVNDDVADIRFRINDSGVFTTYAAIRTAIADATNAAALVFEVRADNGLITGMSLQGDDNNQRFMMILGGTDQARIQPFLGEMGYFVTTQVTDFSLIIGTSGSLQIPRLADNSPTLTALNQAFGAFDGAMGYESVDERLYIRESSTRWVFWNVDGAVT